MTALVISDEQIDACGFRMFALPEIAATMVMLHHPVSGLYVVRGNKREQMAQYGNAVTPPATQLKLERLADVLGGGFTFTDLFCGAGGSSIGAALAGGQLVLGLNHWERAIETHSENFPHADHDCADVSALTTARIRGYPDADVLLASPECTNHSLAKGARRRKPKAASLFDDGPAGHDEQDRSRATMWDVVRFAEQKILKGRPYKAIVVENVVDAYRWGAGDDGGLFTAWQQALTNLGYESEIVWLNSMFCPPTPQSRDRLYVVFWRKGIRRPNLRVEPPSWCPHCERVVEGRQAFKPRRSNGRPVGARYGAQYLYTCPDCHAVVLPGVFPAATAIDFELPAPLIGERDRPLATNTRERIRRGLVKLISEPFAIRLTHGGAPRPLTLPLVTLTRRHDMAMVLPDGTLDRGLVMAYTEDGIPRVVGREPAQTQRTNPTLAMVFANRANNMPRDPALEPSHPILTGGTIGVVHLRQHQDMRRLEDPLGTVSAGGGHHGIVVRNNGSEGSDSGWESTPTHEPFRTLTGRCHQSLVVPYQSEPHSPDEPARTITTRDRLALIVPPMGGVDLRDAHLEPLPTQTTTTRAGIVELPE